MYSVFLSLSLFCAFINLSDHDEGAVIKKVPSPGGINVESMVPIHTLPVVIHVIHTGDPIGAQDNPSDSLIHSMVDLMNEAFRTDGPLYGGPDMDIEFDLAVRSPVCTTTTGITRVNGSVLPNYETGGITNFGFPGSVDEVLVKGLSRWPNTDYINIWIVNKINGDSLYPGGYAYFPEYNSALTDGLVLQASVVNGTNKTVIHELGHYFSLYHIYEDENWEMPCSENLNCSIDGDQICDTEPCLFTTNCNEPLNACTNEDWVIVDPGLNYTVLNNYMGNTNCQWMFTDDQKIRVHDALESFRPGLLTSHALTLSDTSSPATACVPTAVHGLSPNYGIERVEFGALDVYSNTSAADGDFYIDRTCNQYAFAVAGENVFVRITGSYLNYAQIRVYLDYDNDGTFELPGELILSEDGGVVEDSVIIPLSENVCVPIRLRVVSDHPSAPVPGPCLLTGTMNEGVGQIEDYTVMILPRIVESVSSGEWDNPVVWSCNCIPGPSDIIRIQSGHTIDVPFEVGLIECRELELEPGSALNVDSEIRVIGGCN